jgi:hypothetical protein
VLTVDPFEMHERKLEAQRRLRAQREKAGELRGRVVAISLVCFALLWGIVFVQMATGHDPVLGDKSSTVAQRNGGADRHRAKAEAIEEEFIEAEVEPEPEFVEPEPEPEPAPVTTSQS